MFQTDLLSIFYVLFTAHLGIIIFSDQLDAQFFCICFFQFSTYFEHSSAHHQEIKLYQYDIWYMSLYVGDRLLCRFGRNVQTCIPDGPIGPDGLFVSQRTGSHSAGIHVAFTNCFVCMWFCVVHDPKPPLHSHNWLSFGKFQDRMLSYSLWTPFFFTTTL